MSQTIIRITLMSRFAALILLLGIIYLCWDGSNLFNSKALSLDNLPLPFKHHTIAQNGSLPGTPDPARPLYDIQDPDIEKPQSQDPNPTAIDEVDPLPIPSVDETPIGDSDLALVHQSWMEYPQPLSFQGAPSLLDPIHPKDIKILLINAHDGVTSEVHAVFEKILSPLNIKATYELTWGVGEIAGFDVTDEKSQEWWPSHKDYCDPNQYDLIVVGDVITFSRPLLTAACKINIILYITNRFDFRIWGDNHYAQLIAMASRWPNVRVIVNNLFEQRYALVSRHADVHVYAYAPSTGTVTDATIEMFKESDVDWKDVAQSDFIIIGRNQQILITMLQEAGIPPPRVFPRYGGPLALAGRRVIHIPYQVNTMALFENLYVGVIYILPSLRLYESWLEQGHVTMDGGAESGKRVTHEGLLTYVDWYRTDLQFLFFYFDDLTDLAPDSEFQRRVSREAEEKLQVVGEFMKHHTNRSMEAWRQAVKSFPRLADSTPVLRPADSPQLIPPTANLSSPT